MSKLTTYGALATADPADVLPIVDVDDTTMASTGTTKKITTAALLAAAGPLLTRTTVQTANYTASANQIVPCDTTSASLTVTLPNAPAAGAIVAVKDVTLGTGNTVTIACGGSDVINKSGGGTTGSLPLLSQGMLLHYNGSGIWTVLADDLPLSQLDTRYQRTVATVAGFVAQSPGSRLLGHRGLSQVAPEDTMPAFRSALQAMSAAGYVPGLKLDAWKLGDGSFGVIHDNTVDRTTTSTGNVSKYTAQSWQTLLFNSSLVGPAWGSVAIPLLTDVLDQLGGKCVLMIDVKDGTTAACSAILAEITARGLASSCILCHEDTALAMPALCQAAGVGFLYYWNVNAIAGAPTPATVAATAGVTGLAVAVTNAEFGGTSYSDSDISSVASTAATAGIPSYGFSYTRRYHYTRAVSLGLTAHIIDDLYVAASTAARTSDAFSIGAPIPGETGSTFLGTESIEAPVNQYAGTAGNYRRAVTNSPTQAGIYESLGFLAPAANAGTGAYTLAGTLFWDATETGSSDGARFAGIVVGCPDDSIFAGNATVNGYHCLIRQGNGSTYSSPTFQIFKQTRGAYGNNGIYASGTSTQVGSNQTNTTGYAAPNTLGASYASGATITSLTLGSAVTIPAGMKIALPNGQIATVASAVSASTAVTISSLTTTSALTSGQPVSFGIPFSIKVDCSVGGQTTITFKRTDTNDTLTATDSSSPFGGGYCHIGKTGTTSSSTLAVSYAGLSIS